MKLSLALCIGFLTLACGTPEPEVPAARRRHPVAVRAPFDLNCPREQLRYDRLDKNTMGVSGCGRRATYVRVCNDRIASTSPYRLDTYVECRWLLNAAQ
jgi:hypothetical protein